MALNCSGKKALALSSVENRDVVEQFYSVNEEEKRENCELMKKLIQSLYFLVKHHIPHTTTFKDLVTLQIEMEMLSYNPIEKNAQKCYI